MYEVRIIDSSLTVSKVIP